MLLVVLESSLQERRGTVMAGPEESYEDDQRLGHLSYEDRLRDLEFFSLEKKDDSGRSQCGH